MKKILLSCIIAYSLVPSVASSAIIMDSVAEFSNNQGQDGWYYGYYDGDLNAFTPGDFEEMSQYTNINDLWSVQEGVGGFWTSLSATSGHGNGTNSSNISAGRQLVNHWAVRRWISDEAGVLTLNGSLYKSNVNGGNGTVGHIFVDGIEVFSQYISGTDGIGVNYLFDININTGSVIDFAIDPFNSNDMSDGTAFTVTGDISASSVPAPAAVWLLGLGLIGLVNLRKRSVELSEKQT